MSFEYVGVEEALQRPGLRMGGFLPKVASYLARKYGYRPEDAQGYGPRVAGLLGMLAARLDSQRAAGSPYCLGHAMSAVDVYAATAMAMFSPLPPAGCAMDPATRAAFETLDGPTREALSPALLAHRDMMYARHLAMPLSL